MTHIVARYEIQKGRRVGQSRVVLLLVQQLVPSILFPESEFALRE